VDKPRDKEQPEQRRSAGSQQSEGKLSSSFGKSAKGARDQQEIQSLSGGHRSGLPLHEGDASEFFNSLVPEMRRSKPNPDAMAAAMEAVQRLASQADAESVEDISGDSAFDLGPNPPAGLCRTCGYQNREGNKFCGMCGVPVDMTEPAIDEPREELTEARRAPAADPASLRRQTRRSAELIGGAHHYHHHYHHHYFPVGHEGAVSRPVGEPSREADKLRLAAAAKGESMSRAEAAVRRLTQEWVLACNTRQLDDLLDLYITDALMLRPNLLPMRGGAPIREFFFSALDTGFGEVEVEPVRVDVVGDMAYGAGRYAALVPTAVGKRREERGKYLWVFARQSNGEWKLAADCWSSDLTLAAGSESDIGNASGAGLKANLPRKSA